jgi:hypothetical protein
MGQQLFPSEKELKCVIASAATMALRKSDPPPAQQTGPIRPRLFLSQVARALGGGAIRLTRSWVNTSEKTRVTSGERHRGMRTEEGTAASAGCKRFLDRYRRIERLRLEGENIDLHRLKGRQSAPENAKPLHSDRTIEVPLPHELGRDCGGELCNDQVHEQFQTDVPKAQPTTRQFDIHAVPAESVSAVLRADIRSRSLILGAAANQIGPNAIAFAVQVNKSTGGCYDKVCRIFGDTFDFSVSSSTLLWALLCTAGKAEPPGDGIMVIVRGSPMAYGDETGWKVRGLRDWRWAFVLPLERGTV